MEVQGKLVKSPHKMQNMELQAEAIRVVGPCDIWVCHYSRRSRTGGNQFFKGPSMQQSMLETVFSLSVSGPADFDLSAVSLGCIKGETMKNSP